MPLSRIFKYLISLILVAGFTQSFAQNDSTSVDSLKYGPKSFVPTGIRIGMDLISFGQGVQTNGIRAFTQGDVRQWKFAADIDFYRYFLNVEYGRFDRLWIAPESSYRNNGTYFKIGPDINFLQRDPDQSALFIGLRYARATYSDRINYRYTNSFWGNGNGAESNESLQSRWYEVTTGIKVKLWKYIWTGYTARFKFSVNDSYSGNDLVPHWIPGYGRAQEESRWGFEYFLILRLPFREYIPVPKED